ncbi:hypothetical protein D499_0AE00150 [Hanseniaspora uvarum DSM 2768]|nr:hypothetical protein D499_0AE00150 [Hanseniaspora uvarum DSM 2768]GMM43373.1 Ilm1 protein [Hanseniaspora uvarum]
MALFTSDFIIKCRAATYIFLSILCFKNISAITTNNSLVTFSIAMRLPQVVINENSIIVGILSIFLFNIGLLDVLSLIHYGKIKAHFYKDFVLLRLTSAFVITFISYFNKVNVKWHNNFVFLYGFIELWFNFIIYNCLKEELNDVNIKTKRKYEDKVLNEQIDNDEED